MNTICELQALIAGLAQGAKSTELESITMCLAETGRGIFLLAKDDENSNEIRTAAISVTKQLRLPGGILALGQKVGRLTFQIGHHYFREMLFYFPDSEDHTTIQSQESYKNNREDFIEYLVNRCVLLTNFDYEIQLMPGRELFLSNREG